MQTKESHPRCLGTICKWLRTNLVNFVKDSDPAIMGTQPRAPEPRCTKCDRAVLVYDAEFGKTY